MNILIIGGSGAFGSRTVIRLLQDKDVSRVISFDVAPPRDWVKKSIEKYGDKFQFTCGDVTRLEDIVSAIKTYSADRLINFAYLMSGDVETKPRLSMKINVLGMSNSFEAARLMGIKRVVYASSETVYGRQSDHGDVDVTEDSKLCPNNEYGVSKYYAEFQAAAYARLYSLNITALRPAIGYGHGGRTPDSVRWFSNIVSLPAVGKPVYIESDGETQYSMVYYHDIAELTRILVKAPSSRYQTYNIGSQPITLRDVAAQVRRYLPDAKIEFGTEVRPDALVWRLSMAQAKEDLGFSVMPLEKAVLAHINEARGEAGMGEIRGIK